MPRGGWCAPRQSDGPALTVHDEDLDHTGELAQEQRAVAATAICRVEGHAAGDPHVDPGRREDAPRADPADEPLVELDPLRDATWADDLADPERERRVPDRFRLRRPRPRDRHEPRGPFGHAARADVGRVVLQPG